jgi:hypothetical protein
MARLSDVIRFVLDLYFRGRSVTFQLMNKIPIRTILDARPVIICSWIVQTCRMPRHNMSIRSMIRSMRGVLR